MMKNNKLVLSLFISAFLCVLVESAVHAQRTEVRSDEKGLTVWWNNEQRLTQGMAATQGGQQVNARYRIEHDVALFWTSLEAQTLNPDAFAGIFFDDLLKYRRGVALWRYKPWNSWTKPMQIKTASSMPDDDVQFYYWQHDDGTYGAAVPLSGNGFRTTLGNNLKKWGSKSVSYAGNAGIDSIPSLAVAFDQDPFALFERIYRTALQFMGKDENLRTKKTYPEPFDYIGWCTWNASDNGKNLNEELLLNAAESFKKNNFPLGWMLIDDGWFQQASGKLQSYFPTPKKFPNGFEPVIDKLKGEYGIKYMGVWHAFNGLWNGIDPASPLGKHFSSSLFTWTQKERPDKADAPLKTYAFIKPDSDSLQAFYNTWHEYFKNQGFDFVKVDNQLVVERMAVNNYPIFTLSDSMHRALNRSADTYFNGAVINCMDMTAEAYLNFGSSAVARAVEDYFPYEPGETYDLQRGNAAAHVLQAIYNAAYFGQMVYPDFDMLQSHNPNGAYHAIARAINCGPIYITDNIGQQDFDILRQLVYSDGRIIRSSTPLVPAADCLFQVQEPKPFKGWSMARNAGLLGVWNAADAESVEGSVSPHDIGDIKGDDFIAYEYFSKSIRRLKRNDSFDVNLSRLGYRLYYVVPVKKDFASLGLDNKYNGPATVVREVWRARKVIVTLHEGGRYNAYCAKRPSRITINGKATSDYSFAGDLLTVDIPALSKPVVSIKW